MAYVSSLTGVPLAARVGGGIAPLGLQQMGYGGPTTYYPGPEQEQQLIKDLLIKTGQIGLSGVSAAANFLDIPGSVARDLILTAGTGKWHNPFDQLLPWNWFNEQGRVRGRDALAELGMRPNKPTGISGWRDDPGEMWRDLAGFAFEVGTDPLLPISPINKGLKAAGRAAGVPKLAAAAGRLAERTPYVDPLYRAAGVVFDPSVKGQFTKEGRKIAKAVTTLERAGFVEAGKEMFPLVQQVYGYARELPDTKSVADAFTSLRAAAEGAKPLPAEMKHLEPVVTRLRELSGEMKKSEDAAGVLGTLLDDDMVDYVSRSPFFWPNSKNKMDWPARLVSGKGGAQIRRKEWLRGIDGGSDLINTLTVDRELSGVLHRVKASDVDGAFWKAQRGKVRQAMRDSGYGNANMEKEKLQDLTRWLAGLDPRYAEQGVPFFAHNPVEDMFLRLRFSERAVGMSNIFVDTLRGRIVKKGTEEVGMQHTLYDVAEKAGFNAEIIAKRLGANTTDYVPEEIAEAFGKLGDTFKLSEGVQSVLETTDKFLRIFKTGVTTPWPGFHVRNFTSGQIQNWIIGAFNDPIGWMRTLRDAHRMIRGKEVKWINELPEFKGLSSRAATDKMAVEIAAHQIAPTTQGMIFEQVGSGAGAALVPNRGGFAAAGHALDIPGLEPQGLWKSLGQLGGLRRRAGWNPLGTGGVSGTRTTNAFYQAGESFGHYVESLNRIAPYLAFRRKGMTAEMAAARVRSAHVDYQNLTRTEKEIFRRAFPFYTFTRGQAEFVVRELLGNPGGRLAQVMRAQRLGVPTDQVLPEHLVQTGAIPIGETPEGDQSFISGFGLMHDQPLGFLGGGIKGALLEGVAQSRPVLKTAYELMAGQSAFQRGPMGGRTLRDLDPAIGRLLTNVGIYPEREGGQASPVFADLLNRYGFRGDAIGRSIEHVASNLPFTRLITSLRTLSDTRKRLGTEGLAAYLPGPKALTNFLTGVRISDLSPAARYRALREQLDLRTVEDLGGRALTQTWIPPEYIEQVRQVNPLRAMEMDQRNLLQKVIGKRFRDLKKQKALKDLQTQSVQTLA